jgi:hypothetical protein
MIRKQDDHKSKMTYEKPISPSGESLKKVLKALLYTKEPYNNCKSGE